MTDTPTINVCPFSEWHKPGKEIKDRYDEKNRYLPELDSERFYFIGYCSIFPDWLKNELLEAGYKLKYETETEYDLRVKNNIKKYKEGLK